MIDPSTHFIGTTINDRYEIIDILGEGGFGMVFKARQLSTGQLVAIKLMQPELLSLAKTQASAQMQTARFEREMQLIAQLKHPNIVRLIDSGRLEDGQLFTVLEFIEGENLAEVLEREEKISGREMKGIMFQVLDALSAAHSLGIVHRDLKPDNIMLTTTGYRRNAMVLDFGVATVLEELRGEDFLSLTSTAELSGTPAYMAPEQVRQQKVTQQTDLYSWGLVFIECLTGKRAVPGQTLMEVALFQASEQELEIPEPINHEGLRAIIQRAVSKGLEDRYLHARQALAELEVCDLSNWAVNDINFMETMPGISAFNPARSETVQQIDSVGMPVSYHKTGNFAGDMSMHPTLENMDSSMLPNMEEVGLGQTAPLIPATSKGMLKLPSGDALDSPELKPPRVLGQNQRTMTDIVSVNKQKQEQNNRVLWIVVIVLFIFTCIMAWLLFR